MNPEVTIFSDRRPATTPDKLWGSGRLLAYAALVLDQAIVDQLRDVVSPSGNRDNIKDPMVQRYGSAFVSTGRALGWVEGPRLSYIAALLLARLGNRREQLQSVFDDFAAAHLQPNEATYANQLSYLLEMGSVPRDAYLRPMTSGNPAKVEAAKARLAAYVAEKENPVATVPAQRQPTTRRSVGYGGRA